MKKKIQIFLTAILVTIGLLTFNATDSIKLMSSADITSKDNTAQFCDLLLDKNEEVVSVLVYLKAQVDLDSINKQMNEQGATLQDRHKTTVVTLQNTAYKSQTQLVEYLNELQSQKLVKDFKCFWIGNIIRVDAYQSVVDHIALRDDVLWVYPNYEIELIEPVEGSFEIKSSNNDEIEPGVVAVRASEVWEEFNITGEGVLVATIDTGVDGDHPALASRWAGVEDPRYEGHPEWAWFDPYSGQNDFPYDYNGHGTHTMGSVCGGAPGDQIGVAPGALWISAGAIDRGGSIQQTVDDAIESFEWMIDPDGDPETNWDVPDVCSNSWGLSPIYHGVPPCDETFWSFLDACEAAGIVIIFSAGNEGYSGLRTPSDRATDDYRTFAVAAVDANDPEWPIAGFSSRGPTFCTPNGTKAIKPDIAAPGVNVRSSIPGGGYDYGSGTSMASPHINGVVALMREANPNLGVEQIKEIIYQTAYDLGDEGEDNDYGWGMVDAYEAVFLVLPPDKPIIKGPTNGTKFTIYNFTLNSVDPNGDELYYWIDWGDNTSSAWIGPYESGEEIIVNHAWNKPGTYKIRAKTKDILDGESKWSDYHSFYILKPPYMKVRRIYGGFLTINAIIQNLGEIEATNVEWNFNISGGIILTARESTGNITCIPPYGEMPIESKPIIGFGKVTVTLQASIPENTVKGTYSGFIYLFYIKVMPSGS